MMVFNRKNIYLAALLFVLVMNFPFPAHAAFGTLVSSGNEIFDGLRKIIYPASAIGIIAICIGGFFGNINWKWLTAIIIGLIVISGCIAFIDMFAPGNAAKSAISIKDDLATGK